MDSLFLLASTEPTHHAHPAVGTAGRDRATCRIAEEAAELQHLDRGQVGGVPRHGRSSEPLRPSARLRGPRGRRAYGVGRKPGR